MRIKLLTGDCRTVLQDLEAGSVNCVVTSPPYFGLRDYEVDGQLGHEATPVEFVEAIVACFREVWRVLADDGTVWLNLGDSYANDRKWGGSTGGKHSSKLHGTSVGRGKRKTGLKPKDLIGIPWMVAFALRADGWYLRQDIIWSKSNPMPESVTDRCTKSHEYLFLLTKSERYYYDGEAIAEDRTSDEDANGFRGGAYVGGETNNGTMGKRTSRGNRKVKGVPPRHSKYASSDRAGLDDVGRGGLRNRRSVWTVGTQPFKEAHFATFPARLIEPCIKAGCPVGGTVLDPFGGAGTTGLVANRLQRNSVLVDLNPAYTEMAKARILRDAGILVRIEE